MKVFVLLDLFLDMYSQLDGVVGWYSKDLSCGRAGEVKSNLDYLVAFSGVEPCVKVMDAIIIIINNHWFKASSWIFFHCSSQ